MRAYTLSLVVLCACGSNGDATDAGEDQSVNDSSSAKDTGASVDAKNDTGNPTDSGTDSTLPSDSGDDGATDGGSIVDVAIDVAKDSGIIMDGGMLGCLSNNDCLNNEYCEKGVANCNGSGSCKVRPQICNNIFNPVCGCDKKTYSNSCFAAAAGQSVAYSGNCE